MTRKPFSVEKGFIIIWQTSSIGFLCIKILINEKLRPFELIHAILEKGKRSQQ
ncbi:hypothetical protein [Bacillus tequilensis]|uniref:Uncharacterized protein n=1 Tax=Bacillus tequilensis TaxID=227866 RepID=A0A6H0WG16_9BACI|nr:hypothetical protein [Bacillus tequilensis]QIW78909.1 hypothetical protein G4P54_03325 [Bacillus tequilensis]